MKHCLSALFISWLSASSIARASDWRDLKPDLVVPEVSQGDADAGMRVSQTLKDWEGSKVHHLLYLPQDWQPEALMPVLIEFAGNGPYADARGDSCDGSVASCVLGYGISAGKGFIWASLPFVEMAYGGKRNAAKWWGDVEESKRYCTQAVRDICTRYGGDPKRVLLCGFSRGSIGCNFIGMHDDEIAKLWCGFVCHSHYDGVRAWSYAGSDQVAARIRLSRLGTRPQWISHEQSTAATEKWLISTGIQGDWTFLTMPFENHSSAWVLRDMPERKKLRDWVARVVSQTN